MAMFIVKPWYGKKEVDIFGTPSSNNPSNGVISSSGGTPLTAAYTAFGSNEGYGINYIGKTNVLYNFTDGSLYKPSNLTYCTYFTAYHGWQEAPQFKFYGSKDGGSTWTLLYSTTSRTALDTSVTVPITADDYYNTFKFEGYSPSGSGWTGFKGIISQGYKK